MKKYENLYAGIVKRYLVGGIDLDKVRLSEHDQLEIFDGKVKVGFISKDVLLKEKRVKNEYLEPHHLYTDNAGY